MRASVLVITKNRSPLLEFCLASLLKQTRKPDEVVIVDSSSRPQKTLLKKYRLHLNIRYIYKPQCNIPQARGLALQSASNDLALFLDDDCTAEKEWLAKMIKLHQKNPKACLISGQLIHTPKKSLYGFLITNLRSHRFKITPAEKRGIYFNIENCLLMKKEFKKQKIQFDPEMEHEEFADLALQILHHGGKILLTPATKVYHHERNSLMKFLKQRFKNSGNAVRLRKKWSDELYFYGAKRPSYLQLLIKLLGDLFDRRGALMALKLLAVLFLSFLAYEFGYFYHRITFSKIKPLSR